MRASQVAALAQAEKAQASTDQKNVDPTILQRFLTEARSATAIRHPNVCPVDDVGQIDSQCLLTMPLIDGVSLAAWLEQPKTSAREAAR